MLAALEEVLTPTCVDAYMIFEEVSPLLEFAKQFQELVSLYEQLELVLRGIVGMLSRKRWLLLLVYHCFLHLLAPKNIY